MSDLLSLQAMKCQTAIGMLIHDGATLLIKHKKLNVWLAPGGHLEGDELPHQTAEREFMEETGIQVRAIDPFVESWEGDSQYFPSSILTNLHWVSRENYDARQASGNLSERHRTEMWPKGCEQHVGFIFVVEPVGSIEIHPNSDESQEVRWFTPDEVRVIPEGEIYHDTREELLYVFSLAQVE